MWGNVADGLVVGTFGVVVLVGGLPVLLLSGACLYLVLARLR